jgi:predicted nucleotidyltransferase component of viral defense system
MIILIASFIILVYSLDEIILEKLRSIIQRGKSRDYFDVWMLLNKKKFDKDKIKDLFMKKCKFKNIKPDYEMFFEELEFLQMSLI